MEEAGVDVWSVAALPREFPSLVETDFVFDGVHLNQVHNSTIRRAVEDAVMTAALLQPAGPRVVCYPLDSSGACHCCGRSDGSGSHRTDGGGGDGRRPRTGGRTPPARGCPCARRRRPPAPAAPGGRWAAQLDAA